MLKGKHAVLFGAGGSFGFVVTREFAAEGPEVFRMTYNLGQGPKPAATHH